MAQQTDKKPSVLRSIDWLTILFYLGLLTFGWVSVCGAYSFGFANNWRRNNTSN